MTSHRMHGLGCPIPSPALMPLATAGLLSLSMPSLVGAWLARFRPARREAPKARGGARPPRHSP